MSSQPIRYVCHCTSCARANPVTGYGYVSKTTKYEHIQKDRLLKGHQEIEDDGNDESFMSMDIDDYDLAAESTPATADAASNYNEEEEDGIDNEDDFEFESNDDDMPSTENQEEEEEDPMDRYNDNSYLPTDPVCMLFFLMLFMLHSKYVTDEGLTLIMGFLNAALNIMNHTTYRFPKYASTFKAWCKFGESVHAGLTEYASCEKCHAIHRFNTNEEKKAIINRKVCHSREPFPGSPLCQNNLFKQYSPFKPKRSFFYNSLKSTLQRFFLREDFVSNLKKWKQRENVDGLLRDIYDGQVWKTFKMNQSDNVPFVFESVYNLMLTINVDWFQPFSGSAYSCGAIYLAIQNLPREIRQLRENIILVGLIGGPREPSSYQMNHYLAPLVDELLELSAGVNIMTRAEGVQLVKCALTLVVCDLPACRKVCGFTSFSSIYACHKCNRAFDAVSEGSIKRDYSGFDDGWIPRTCSQHRSNANDWLKIATKSGREKAERSNGTRYSELLRLHYFDPIRFSVFDVMHNICLGTMKRLLCELWRDEINPPIEGNTEAILNNAALKDIQARAKVDFVLPLGYDGLSSISRKATVGQGFSHMKADELRVFALAMSPYLLSNGNIKQSCYQNWLQLVEASRILFAPSISFDQVEKCHELIKSFLNGFMSVYSNPVELLTSNMHFHLHLKEGLLDYGPMQAQWAFSFERYNGDIKNIATNHHGSSVELTFFKKFLLLAHQNDYINALRIDNSVVLSALDNITAFIGGKSTEDKEMPNLEPFSLVSFLEKRKSGELFTGSEPLPEAAWKSMSVKQISIDSAHYGFLVKYYNHIYGDSITVVPDVARNFIFETGTEPKPKCFLSPTIYKFKHVNLFGNIYKTMDSSSSLTRGSYAKAMKLDGTKQCCQIMYFFLHKIDIEDIGDDELHALAFVRWFSPPLYPLSAFNQINNMEVCQNRFEPESVDSIIPIHQILNPIAIKFNHIEEHNVVINLAEKHIS